MSKITIKDEIIINTPINKVWEAIKNPTIHAKWHPFVTHIAGEHKLNAVRKCDVIVGKKSAHTEERCSLYEEVKKIIWNIEKDTSGFSKMVSDWSAGFTLEPKGSNATRVTAQSIFQPKNLFVSLMTPFINMKFHQTQKTILKRLKEFAEKRGGDL